MSEFLIQKPIGKCTTSYRNCSGQALWCSIDQHPQSQLIPGTCWTSAAYRASKSALRGLPERGISIAVSAVSRWVVKVRAVAIKMGKPGRWDLSETRSILLSMLQWDDWLLQLRCFGVDAMFLSLFSKILPSSPWDQTLSQVYGANFERSTWRAESFQLTILQNNSPWTSIAKWCQTSWNLLVSQAVTEVTMSPNCAKKLSASCEEPQRRLLEKVVLYITYADGPVLGTLHKRRFSNVLQISDYFKLCYPNEPQPAISCSCLHSRVLVHETKETDPLATALFNENCRKEWRNHLVWKESPKELYSNLISWLHIWLPTSFQKSGNNQEKGNNRRNWFPTPFPGSKTFQLYKEPKPWLNSL